MAKRQKKFAARRICPVCLLVGIRKRCARCKCPTEKIISSQGMVDTHGNGHFEFETRSDRK